MYQRIAAALVIANSQSEARLQSSRETLVGVSEFKICRHTIHSIIQHGGTTMGGT